MKYSIATEFTALSLASHFRNTSAFSMNLKTRYDFGVAQGELWRRSNATCNRWKPRQAGEAQAASSLQVCLGGAWGLLYEASYRPRRPLHLTIPRDFSRSVVVDFPKPA